jgi:integrase
MGTVFNRGTRDRPNWYVGYQEHGEWKYRPSHQPTKAQAKRYVAEVEARLARGQVGIEEAADAPRFAPLLQQFLDGLTNRNAGDDRSRARRHLVPAFSAMRVPDVTLAKVMAWIDEQRAAGEIGDSSIRHNMNLLSRFFSWAIARGHAEINPVRQIPMGSRPTQTVKSDTRWLDDDAVVRKLIADLEEPISYMFYLGNRSGLRTGEAAGLRVSDFAFVEEGLIRVRSSYDGPLKEDKKGVGKVKWVPAPEDCAEFLGPWLAQRKAQGAGPEDRVFPCARRKGLCFRKEYIEQCWEKAAPKHVGARLVKVKRKPTAKSKKGEIVERERPTMTWYEATRHSFVSRHLAAGASLDEVSAAVGHSSPVVTKRFYDHFVRRSFSPKLRAGLGLGKSKGGEVTPMRKTK